MESPYEYGSYPQYLIRVIDILVERLNRGLYGSDARRSEICKSLKARTSMATIFVFSMTGKL